jgi:hypothetical protein
MRARSATPIDSKRALAVLNARGSYRLVGWLTALSYALVVAFAYRPSRAAESGLRNQ